MCERHVDLDIRAIASGTNISDNVVDMVESKIKKLHPHVQTVLQIASCLGFQFPRDVLDQYALETLLVATWPTCIRYKNI
jgi:predicted ATPase